MPLAMFKNLILEYRLHEQMTTVPPPTVKLPQAKIRLPKIPKAVMPNKAHAQSISAPLAKPAVAHSAAPMDKKTAGKPNDLNNPKKSSAATKEQTTDAASGGNSHALSNDHFS